MRSKIIVKTDKFKNLLSLLELDTYFIELEIFDIGYGKIGYTDESIFKGNHSLQYIYDFDYSFSGLYYFKGKTNDLEIQLLDFDSCNYEIIGIDFRLRAIIHKMLEKNIFSPSLFVYSEILTVF